MPFLDYNPSLPPLKKGDLLGEYEILELTSNPGGFGRIYRARRTPRPHCERSKDYYYAIKEFHVREMEDIESEWNTMYSYTRNVTKTTLAAFRTNFFQEAKLLWLLSRERDSHVPHLYSNVKEQDGRLFYAMAYIDGLTLRETLDELGLDCTMSEQKALNYIIQIAKILHKAHKVGLIHADVSPNNIMIQKNTEYAVLVDWGNAKSYDNARTLASIREEDRSTFQSFQEDLDRAAARIPHQSDLIDDNELTIFTSGFRAPDSFIGKRQADVYSLAATLFFLLTRKKIRVPSDDRHINDIHINWMRKQLAEHNISEATTNAIVHAMNADINEATSCIRDFLIDLPVEGVVEHLLSYTEHGNY